MEMIGRFVAGRGRAVPQAARDGGEVLAPARGMAIRARSAVHSPAGPVQLVAGSGRSIARQMKAALSAPLARRRVTGQSRRLHSPVGERHQILSHNCHAQDTGDLVVAQLAARSVGAKDELAIVPTDGAGDPAGRELLTAKRCAHARCADCVRGPGIDATVATRERVRGGNRPTKRRPDTIRRGQSGQSGAGRRGHAGSGTGHQRREREADARGPQGHRAPARVPRHGLRFRAAARRVSPSPGDVRERATPSPPRP